MIDAIAGRRCHSGLGMQRDAKAGNADHVEVISTIAYGHGLAQVEPALGGERFQADALGILVDDRLLHRTRKLVAIELEHIGDCLVKADPLAEIVGKERKAARNQRGEGTIGLHRMHQCPTARGQGDGLAANLFDGGAFESLEQGHAGIERLSEVQLAAHGAFGDFGDLCLETQGSRQFIDALLLDHGGVHVRDEQLLATALGGHDIGVNAPVSDDFASDIEGVGRPGLDNIAGDLMAQPVEFSAGLLHHCGRKRDVEVGIGGIGDEAENRHGENDFRETRVTRQRSAVLIAGPTASGKSSMALQRARANGGVIVNTDAMQVYDTLRIVTARPSVEEEAQAEHRLYGAIPASQRFSTGQWLEAVRIILAEIDPAREVIFVGGTGLYFEALTNGFADVPEISQELTLQVQREIEDLDEAGRMALLTEEDRETARRLKVADPQRVTRALAVKRATGKPLSAFQDNPQSGLLGGWAIERFVLSPDRDVLRARIALRFEAMFAGGAVEEVEALRAQNLDPSLPVMKAIGVPEISDWLDGVQTREEAITLATIATHQYAKRQRTWFRNRMGDWPRLGLEGAALS